MEIGTNERTNMYANSIKHRKIFVINNKHIINIAKLRIIVGIGIKKSLSTNINYRQVSINAVISNSSLNLKQYGEFDSIVCN